jgi:hypothetical protein
MIRDGDFADRGTFQKAARETFKRDGFLKRALFVIGSRSPFFRTIYIHDTVDPSQTEK